MNELVERLAREAGFDTAACGHYAMVDNVDCTEELKRFAALVAQECEALVIKQLNNVKSLRSIPAKSEAAFQAALDIRAAFPMPKG